MISVHRGNMMNNLYGNNPQIDDRYNRMVRQSANERLAQEIRGDQVITSPATIGVFAAIPLFSAVIAHIADKLK